MSAVQCYAIKSNSLLGNVVLDSFNMIDMDEDSILDQIYEKQICLAFYSEDLIFFE